MTTGPVGVQTVSLPHGTNPTLTIVFSGNLSATPVPFQSQFDMTQAVPGVTALTVNSISSVSISGATIVLQLTGVAYAGDKLVLSYNPGTNPVVDANGTPLYAFSRVVTIS